MPEWIGKTIGKVRIEKLLARGGMAEVYLGTHLTLARPVAVKLLHSFIEEEPVLLERFQREARVVAGLRHPNIVQVFDFDTVDGHPYIVMEYLKGPTLATYLRYLSQRKKRVPFDQIARLLKGLTAGLDYAHKQGVIHRDIKPANILLHNRADEIPLDKTLPNDVEAIVTDFGLVRVINEVSQTTSGILSGTPIYMSPEQASGDQIDHRSDLYSLGIVLYEMLAGRLPFQADNTLTVLHMHIHATPLPIPGIPAKVQAVIDHALLKNPDDRYQTSRELAIDFYRSIGMTADRGIIEEPNPVPVPIAPPSETPVSLTPKAVPLPADLLEMLTHANSNVRKLAVQELVGLMDGKHLGLARAAQEKLREIASTDDSLTLRQIAVQALNVRGLESDLPAPVESQKEKLNRKPSALLRKPWSPQKYFSPFVNRLTDLNPLPKLVDRKLPKLEKRLVGGILGVALGVVLIAGASKLFFNSSAILRSTATATGTFTQLATSTPPPSRTIALPLGQTSSPTLTRTPTHTPTSTPSPTLTSTPTATKTRLPLFTAKPTRKKNGGGGQPPPPPP